MKILSCIAALTALLLPACSAPESAASTPCVRLSVAAVRNRSLDISFRRGISSRIIVLHLAWVPSGAPFYTPYGPLQALTLTEGASSVVAPPERIGHIEDIWPDSITLRSARAGSYELSIPQGVPAAAPEVIVFRSGRFAGIHTGESFYPPPPSSQ